MFKKWSENDQRMLTKNKTIIKIEMFSMFFKFSKKLKFKNRPKTCKDMRFRSFCDPSTALILWFTTSKLWGGAGGSIYFRSFPELSVKSQLLNYTVSSVMCFWAQQANVRSSAGEHWWITRVGWSKGRKTAENAYVLLVFGRILN